MARYEGKNFRNETVNVENNEYIGCSFEDCVRFFRGDIDGPMVMKDCRFGERIAWRVEGPASRVIEFLNVIYHAAPHGRERVEEMFEMIRKPNLRDEQA
jgi:hypothetical protein